MPVAQQPPPPHLPAPPSLPRGLRSQRDIRHSLCARARAGAVCPVFISHLQMLQRGSHVQMGSSEDEGLEHEGQPGLRGMGMLEGWGRTGPGW